MKNFTLLSKILLALTLSHSLIADDFENIPKLTVRGSASLNKPADQVEITLGIYTRDKSSTIALNENNQNVHQLLSNLQAIGLDEQDYQTGRFTITPVYQKETKDTITKDLTAIDYYEVINTVAVKTLKITLIEKILEEALKAGANQIQNLTFTAHDASDIQQQAIGQATKNAFETAKHLAHAAHLRLPRVLSISLDQFQNHTYAMPMNFKVNDSTNLVPPITNGTIDIDANVTVVFEIAPL